MGMASADHSPPVRPTHPSRRGSTSDAAVRGPARVSLRVRERSSCAGRARGQVGGGSSGTADRTRRPGADAALRDGSGPRRVGPGGRAVIDRHPRPVRTLRSVGTGARRFSDRGCGAGPSRAAPRVRHRGTPGRGGRRRCIRGGRRRSGACSSGTVGRAARGTEARTGTDRGARSSRVLRWPSARGGCRRIRPGDHRRGRLLARDHRAVDRLAARPERVGCRRGTGDRPGRLGRRRAGQ
jgi:hypothetical protein